MTNNVKTPRYLTPSEIELWELSKKATPGPWLRDDDEPGAIFAEGQMLMVWEDGDNADCYYVAAASPDTIAALLETLEKTRGLLSELVDPDECWYDHHGYCQTHTLDEKPCPHTRARALLSGFSGDAPSEEE